MTVLLDTCAVIWAALAPSSLGTHARRSISDPGNVVIHARSGGDRGLFIGDVLHHPLQCIRPEWSTFACTDAAGSRVSRTRLVQEHADSDTLIMPAHFPAPTAGHIKRHGGSYRFAFRE